MTRVPKFRAWDKIGKKMFTNSQIIVWNDNVYANDGDQLSVDHLRGWSIDEKYLMQSTGFKDKNGVELFDGDIVTASEHEYMGAGVVRYEESLAWFVVKFTNRLLQEKPQFIYQYGELEVIGNVYENKELLE